MAAAETEAIAGRGDELPHAQGPGPRQRARLEAALDQRKPAQLLRQPRLAQHAHDHRTVLPGAAVGLDEEGPLAVLEALQLALDVGVELDRDRRAQVGGAGQSGTVDLHDAPRDQVAQVFLLLRHVRIVGRDGQQQLVGVIQGGQRLVDVALLPEDPRRLAGLQRFAREHGRIGGDRLRRQLLDRRLLDDGFLDRRVHDFVDLVDGLDEHRVRSRRGLRPHVFGALDVAVGGAPGQGKRQQQGGGERSHERRQSDHHVVAPPIAEKADDSNNVSCRALAQARPRAGPILPSRGGLENPQGERLPVSGRADGSHLPGRIAV